MTDPTRMALERTYVKTRMSNGLMVEVEIDPPAKSLEIVTVSQEWSINAEQRRSELDSRNDPAYDALENLLVRSVKQLVEKKVLPEHPFRILDIGCWVGRVSQTLAEAGHDVYAVDISEDSVNLAHKLQPLPHFLVADAQSLSTFTSSAFDLVIANMTLHAVRDLYKCLRSCRRVLRDGGILLATLPHPSFYLQSRFPELAVDYNDEVALKLPFRISQHQAHPSPVTYFHRSLNIYLKRLKAAGFTKFSFGDAFREPVIGPGREHDIVFFEAVARR